MRFKTVTRPDQSPFVEATHGACSAKIYLTEKKKGERTYPEHWLVYSEAGRRVRRVFADMEEAKAEAEIVLTKLDAGQSQVLTLTSTDRENYVLAMEELRGLDVPLLTVARE